MMELELKKPSTFATPDDAETAFYSACESADLALMMSVWANDDEIACIHPVGIRLVGREEVEQGWHAIFRNSRLMKFRITDRQCFRSSNLAIHILYENIRIGDSDRAHPPVVSTNIYRLTDNGWHMILHHASPTPDTGNMSIPTVH